MTRSVTSLFRYGCGSRERAAAERNGTRSVGPRPRAAASRLFLKFEEAPAFVPVLHQRRVSSHAGGWLYGAVEPPVSSECPRTLRDRRVTALAAGVGWQRVVREYTAQ